MVHIVHGLQWNREVGSHGFFFQISGIRKVGTLAEFPLKIRLELELSPIQFLLLVVYAWPWIILEGNYYEMDTDHFCSFRKNLWNINKARMNRALSVLVDSQVINCFSAWCRKYILLGDTSVMIARRAETFLLFLEILMENSTCFSIL